MRFLANENFPGDAIRLLELAGHDIVWVRTAAPGISDPDALAWAVRACQGIIESTFERVKYGFTIVMSYHMLCW